VANFTGHGASNLLTADHLITKLLWALIILVSVCFCTFFILTSLQQFLGFDVVTNIRVVKVAEIDFPAITFCEHTNNMNFDNSLYKCTFNGQEYSPQAVFERIEMLYFGGIKKCLRVNGRKINDLNKKLFKSNRYGGDNGLNVVMGFPSHVHYYIGDNSYDPGYYSLVGLTNPGKTTDLIISKTTQTRLGPPYNQCLKDGNTFDSDLFRETAAKDYTYRQVNCFDLCFRQYYIKACSSTEGVYTECYLNFTQNFDNNKICSEFCPLECDLVKFDVEKHEYSLATTALLKNSSDISSEITHNLWIYYHDLEFTEILQLPKMTGTDLISSIGGTLGKAFLRAILICIAFVEKKTRSLFKVCFLA